MENSTEKISVRGSAFLHKWGGINLSVVCPSNDSVLSEIEGEDPDAFLPHPFWRRWDFFMLVRSKILIQKIFNMKQNVLEKTAYLAPSCKAIDVRVEGVLCGSYGDDGQAGKSILDDVYGNGEDF